MVALSTAEYADALRAMRKPSGRQRDFLRAHARAPGRAAAMTRLAEAAGYKSYRPVNLLYSKLAARIGGAHAAGEPAIVTVMGGAKPNTVSNAHSVLVMHPEFAEARRSPRRAGSDVLTPNVALHLTGTRGQGGAAVRLVVGGCRRPPTSRA